MKETILFFIALIMLLSCKEKKSQESYPDRIVHVQCIWSANSLSGGAKIVASYVYPTGQYTTATKTDTISAASYTKSFDFTAPESIHPSGNINFSCVGQIINDVSTSDSLQVKIFFNSALQGQSGNIGKNNYYYATTGYNYTWSH